MKVLFVDEDVGQMAAWQKAAETIVGCECIVYRYADRAMEALRSGEVIVDFAIVDLMLAVYRPNHPTFTRHGTRDFSTTGLVFVKQCFDEGLLKPNQCTILTSVTSMDIWHEALRFRTMHRGLSLYRKSSYRNVFEFAEYVRRSLETLETLNRDQKSKGNSK